MKEVKYCSQHPHERAFGQCSSCGRDICSICRSTYGYFCSEACKQQLQEQTEQLAVPEEQAAYDAVERRVERSTRIVTRFILPAAIAVVAGIIIFKVTSRAGKQVWEFRPDEDRPMSAMTVSRDSLYVGCEDATLYALDKASGDVRWRFKAHGELSQARPAVVEPGVCIIRDETGFYGVNTADGSVAWKQPLAGKVRQQPVVRDGRVYYVEDFYKEVTEKELQGSNGFDYRDILFPDASSGEAGAKMLVRTASALYALDGAGGKELWARALEMRPAVGHLAAAGDLICLSMQGMEDGKQQHRLLALDSATGKGRWELRLESDQFSPTLVLPTEQGILLASAKRIYLVSEQGQEVWRHPRETALWEPVVAGGKVYCRDSANRLTALDLETGKQVWSVEAGDIISDPVVGEELVFVSGFIEKKLDEKETKEIKLPEHRTPGLDPNELIGQLNSQLESGVKLVPVIHALDEKTGDTVWTCENAGGKVLYSEGKLFVIASTGFFSLLDLDVTHFNRITALDARRGKLLWKHRHEGAVHSFATDRATFFLISNKESFHITSIASSRRHKPKGNALHALSTVR